MKSISNLSLKIITTISIIGLSLAIYGCGSSSSNTNDNKNKLNKKAATISIPLISTTIRGVVVDGYIKNATVCIDANEDNSCSFEKIKTKTNEKGEYTLTFQSKPNTSHMLIALGGTYTATNKKFNEIYKNVIKIKDNKNRASQFLNITPITTLVTYIYYGEIKPNINYSINTAISKVGTSLGLEDSQVLLNPLMNKAVFEKTQQIVHTVAILSSSIQADETNYNAKEALKFVIDKLSNSISKGEHQGGLDSSQLISVLEKSTYEGKRIFIPNSIFKIIQEDMIRIEEKVSISKIEDLISIQVEMQKILTSITTDIVTANISSESENSLASPVITANLTEKEKKEGLTFDKPIRIPFTNTGGKIDKCTTGKLPEGLTINEDTCEISGTPTGTPTGTLKTVTSTIGTTTTTTIKTVKYTVTAINGAGKSIANIILKY